jgi:hypothetical protein
MSRKSHPYEDLEKLPAWKVINKAVDDLSRNGDLEEQTARAYIVGYILKKLSEAGALAPRVHHLNGSKKEHVPQAAGR